MNIETEEGKMSDNKQLAEQVAKLLGDYEIHTESGSDVLWLYKNKSMIARYESWPLTGMMIEEMERLGGSYGYHIAIAKALVEASECKTL